MITNPLDYPKTFEVDVKAVWNKRTGGNVSTGFHEIAFDTCSEFGGENGGHCPDELFLSSLCGCLITTLLSFFERFEIGILDLNIKARMNLQLKSSGYKLRSVDMKVDAVAHAEDQTTVKRILDLGEEYCHLLAMVRPSGNIRIENRVLIQETEP